MTEILIKTISLVSFAFRLLGLFIAVLLFFLGVHPVLVGILALPLAWNVGEEWVLWWYKRTTYLDD